MNQSLIYGISIFRGREREWPLCQDLHPCLPAWWLRAWKVRAFPSLVGAINIHRLVIGVVVEAIFLRGMDAVVVAVVELYALLSQPPLLLCYARVQTNTWKRMKLKLRWVASPKRRLSGQKREQTIGGINAV